MFVFWANDGRINHEDSMTCIRLMGEEVLPAIRETARHLDLKDPFEAETPVSLAHQRSMERSGQHPAGGGRRSLGRSSGCGDRVACQAPAGARRGE